MNGPLCVRLNSNDPAARWGGVVAGFIAWLVGASALAGPIEYAALVQSPAYGTVRHLPLGDASGGQFVDGVDGVAGQLVSMAGAMPFVVDGPLFEIAPPTSGALGGGGVIFDGVSNQGLIEASAFGEAFNQPDGASVVVWFRAFDTSRGAVAGVVNSDGSGFQLLLGANQFPYLANPFQVTFVVSYAGGRGAFTSASVASTDFASGEWHMLAGTFKQGVARLYVDGEPLRLLTADVGGTGRVSAFDRPVALGGVNDATAFGGPAVATRKASVLSQVSMHARELTGQQIRELWLTAQGSTGAKVYNAAAARAWFDASATQRVDVALVGDSNQLFGYSNGTVSGHLVGLTQGLRTLMPLYASSVISGSAFGGLANEVNGLTPPFAGPGSGGVPPAFVSSRIPPASAGFGSEPYYVATGLRVQSQAGFRGSLTWDSPLFPFDFRETVDWALTYATFGGGGVWSGGVFPAGIRRFQAPFTTLVEQDLSSDGTLLGTGDAIVDGSMRLPAGARDAGVQYSLQMTDPGDDRPVIGPVALLYSRLVAAERSVGASVTSLWGVGGHGARLFADALVNQATPTQLRENLRQIVRHQGAGRERLLVMIILGGNDLGDSRQAVELDGSLSPIASSTAAGQKLNTLTAMTRLKAAWVAQGYDPAKLVFVLGPYHPAPTSGPKLRSVYVRGWRELQRDHPEFNIVIMDGMSVSSPDAFFANGWYNLNGADVAHLSSAGYEGFGELTWQALRDAVNDLPSPGVCCLGSICGQRTAADCAADGGRFVAQVACNSGGDAVVPCCRADFDQSEQLGVQDIFAFLASWFAGEAKADFAGNGTMSPPGVQSVFEFVSAWFAGCG